MVEVKDRIQVGDRIQGDEAVIAAQACGGIATAVSAAPVASKPRELFSLDRPDALVWTAPHPKEGSHILTTAAEMSRLWLEHSGCLGDLPEVDFEQEMVLAVFAGEGLFREVPCIERVKQGTMEVLVYVSRLSRPWIKRNPMSVLRVPRTLLPVRFVYLS